MDDAIHRALGLTDSEYEDIRKILHRDPNHLELAMFAVMWSEHCSYKSSKVHLRQFGEKAAPYRSRVRGGRPKDFITSTFAS